MSIGQFYESTLEGFKRFEIFDWKRLRSTLAIPSLPNGKAATQVYLMKSMSENSVKSNRMPFLYFVLCFRGQDLKIMFRIRCHVPKHIHHQQIKTLGRTLTHS